jgi:hypothetical protein
VDRRHSTGVQHLRDVEDAPRRSLLRVRQQVCRPRVTQQLARLIIAVRVLLLDQPAELALQLGHVATLDEVEEVAPLLVHAPRLLLEVEVWRHVEDLRS